MLYQGLYAQPIIHKFTPASGAPGTAVTVTGTGFNATPANNIVYFGGMRAAVTSASNTSLTVIAPHGATYQPITVTTNGLTAYSALSFITTFPGGGALTASSFTPNGDLPTGESPYSTAIGDLDGDGKPDIVTVDGGYPYSVSVYKNTGFNGAAAFTKGRSLATDLVPFGVAMGDVTGDGKPDLVVTNSGNTSGYTISVYKNVSTADSIFFDAGVQYATGGGPQSVFIRDLNADGRPDILVANFVSSNMSIFRNTGTGGAVSFAPKIEVYTNTRPTDIAAADFNEDGKIDLAVVNSGNNFVAVYNNISTSDTLLFARGMNFNTGVSPKSFCISDLDGDGKLDMAVTNAGANNIAVLRNTSAGGMLGFTTPTLINLTGGPNHIAVADLDGDGRPDIVTTGDKLSIVRNRSSVGNMAFDPAAAIRHDGENIAVGDIDGDDRPDLVTVTQSGNIASIFRNTVTGPNITSFTPDSAITGTTITIRGTNFTGATAVSFGEVAAASFKVHSDSVITAVTGQGDTGVVRVTTAIRSGERAGFTWLPGPVITSFTPAIASTGSMIAITGTHLDGATAVSFGGMPAKSFTVISPARIEAIVDAGTSGAVSVTTPKGSISATGFTYVLPKDPPVIHSFTPLSGPAGTVITINGANFSTNAASNIVAFGAVRGKVISATGSQLTVSVPPGATYQPVTVTANNLTARSAQPFDQTFSGGGVPLTATSFKPYVYVATGRRPISTTSCDLDGDGLSDVVTASDQFGVVSVLPSTSKNNVFSLGNRLEFETGGSSANHVTYGDIDSDGRPDLVVSTNGAGIAVLKNTSTPGNISFANRINIITAFNPYRSVVADLDGDGKPEISIVHKGSLTLAVFKNNTVGSTIAFNKSVIMPTGNYPYYITAGDLDGDGKAELLVPAFSANIVSVYKNTSTTGNISLANGVDYPTNATPQSVHLGDLNGDGKPEIVVVSSDVRNNYLSVFRNNSTPGSLVIAPRVDYNTVTGSVEACFADFDGDGKPDIATVNPGGNYASSVFRNTSSNDAISLEAAAIYPILTLATSVAVGDLTGDGKPDIVGTALGDGRVSILQNDIAGGLAPVVRSFTPANGATGSTITIKGQYFTGATTVSFGGVPADTFTVEEDTVITAVVGAGATGAVSVTTPGGSGTQDGFKFNAPVPVISAMLPDNAGSGEVVQISGAHLADVTAVYFDSVPAASFAVLSDTVITAIVGAGASGSIRAATLTDTVSLAGFTYIPAPVPVINSFIPALAATGDTVMITGSNFTGVTAVSFGGAPAASFTVISPASITAVVGNGATGAVSVSGSGGNGSRADFTYIPPVPVISSFTPATAATGATITISGSYFDGATQVLFGGVPAASFTVVSPTSITAVVGSGGSGKVTVTTGKGADSLAGFTYTPAPPVINSFFPSSTIFGSTVSIHGSNFTNVTQVLFGGVPAAQFTVNSSIYITAMVSYGATGDITVITNGGTVSRPGFRITPPLPIITSFTPAKASGGETVTIKGLYLTGTSEVRLGFVDAASFKVENDSIVTAVVSNTPGVSTVSVLTTPSGSVYKTGFTYDTTGPVINSFTPTYGSLGQTVTITGKNFTNVTRVTFGGGDATSFTVNSPTSISAVVGTGTPGNVPVAVTANGRTTTRAGFTLYPPAPVISSFTPTSARTGDTVTITGQYFDSNISEVSFAGHPASRFTVNSPTSITAVVGDGASGTVYIYSSGGYGMLAGFTYIPPPPVVTSFSPATAGTGTAITIKGEHFNIASQVLFGGVPAASFTIDSSRGITAIVGNGATGPVSVISSEGTGTLAGFTYTGGAPAPVISSFTPTSAGTGATVRIIGNNFQNVTQVSFGGVAAASFTVDSITGITAVVGAGATGPVVVVTDAGTASLNGFTYNSPVPAPVISSFTPTSAGADATVTISGENFVGVTRVTFGGVDASFTVLSSTTIAAVVGTGAAGAVSVTASGGTASLDGFTYINPPAAPVISSFTPASAGTGATVRIIGNNFQNVTQVSFGGVAAASFTVDSITGITAVVGAGATGPVVVVTDAGIASLNGFTYNSPVPAPVISSFTPTSAAAAGAVITINGNYFDGAFQVLFGGVPAASFTVDSTRGITAVVGSGASGDITVVTSSGTINYPGFVFTAAKAMNVFPNPVNNGTIHIRHPGSTKISHVELQDMSGNLIKLITVPPNTTQSDISGLKIYSGMYQVIWTDGDKREVQRIMVL